MAGESAGEIAHRARHKARRLEAYAANWEAGSVGEAATAAVLDTLPSDWFALHDVRWPGRPRANIDHVVVGPGGIFVIDSKHWSGRVWLSGGVLRNGSYRKEKEVAGAAAAALAVAQVAGPYAGFVRPVICFTGEASCNGRAGDVTLCALAWLRQSLVDCPTVLNARQVADVCVRIGAVLRPASGGAALPPVGPRTASGRHPAADYRPRRWRSTASSRKTCRRRRAVMRPIAGAAIILTVFLAGPSAWSAIGDGLVNVFVQSHAADAKP